MAAVRYNFITLVISLAATLSVSSAALASDTPLRGREPSAIVFVADGAGNFQAASKSLRDVVTEEKLPVYVETFEWSHGNLRILADQLDTKHSRETGIRLADEVAKFHVAHPYVKIFLMGHSAGSGVVLTAAEHVPPGIIEGVVLLSPSVSTTYDLRPALRACRDGVDVFYSEQDWFYLAFATRVFGTADRRRAATSGRVGFQVSPKNHEEAMLYGKLRQRAWQHEDAFLGNRGGHYGNYQPDFLRTYVLPILYAPRY